MNIGFFDPISQRWIKPRPEKEPDAPSLYDIIAENYAMAERARAEEIRKAEAERIWAITRQVAEGCNHIPVVEAGPIASSPMVIGVPPEYEIVESLGYVYWKPKVTI